MLTKHLIGQPTHTHIHRLQTFQHFGIQTCNLFKNLYSQTSYITTNKLNSERFLIKQGNRQGCPFSPLLFNVALDQLIRHLLSDDTFQGIKIDTHQQKLIAYARDILLFIDRPKTNKITAFGNIAGFQINLGKPEALQLQHTHSTDWNNPFPI